MKDKSALQQPSDRATQQRRHLYKNYGPLPENRGLVYVGFGSTPVKIGVRDGWELACECSTSRVRIVAGGVARHPPRLSQRVSAVCFALAQIPELHNSWAQGEGAKIHNILVQFQAPKLKGRAMEGGFHTPKPQKF